MSKLIPFRLANLQDGTFPDGYVDAAEIVSWHSWKVPNPTPPHIDRAFRDALLVSINLKGGLAHWTDEEFHGVSAKILNARGQAEDGASESGLALKAARTGKTLSVV